MSSCIIDLSKQNIKGQLPIVTGRTSYLLQMPSEAAHLQLMYKRIIKGEPPSFIIMSIQTGAEFCFSHDVCLSSFI